MQAVSTRGVSLPAGHYAQAIVHGGVVYVAGQLPIDPEAAEQRIGSVEEQTEQTLRNLRAILEAAGSSLDRVLKTTVYAAAIRLWDQVNAVYARVFGQHRPARAVVPVSELHHGFLVEIKAVAALEEQE